MSGYCQFNVRLHGLNLSLERGVLERAFEAQTSMYPATACKNAAEQFGLNLNDGNKTTHIEQKKSFIQRLMNLFQDIREKTLLIFFCSSLARLCGSESGPI